MLIATTVIVLGAWGAHQCYSDDGCARWEHLLARRGYVEVVPIVVHSARSIRLQKLFGPAVGRLF